jgi:ABC-type bacteriocin/lantibiotic exporter with double-glycine peptidase domain
MTDQCFNIRYSVPGMSQPTDKSCWATSFAMLINYSQGASLTPADVAAKIGKTVDEYDNNTDDRNIAQAFGLTVDACTCMNIDGWRQKLESYGPLYIGINGNTHAVLITGMESDGTPETTKFYINDPADGAVSKSYEKLTQIYEQIDDEQEFWIAHA